jgi:metal-dependent hydrolase (beta-lactamase superfamily II)
MKDLGKQTLFLSLCSHAGTVNMTIQAQKSIDTDNIHAIMGGFHH